MSPLNRVITVFSLLILFWLLFYIYLVTKYHKQIHSQDNNPISSKSNIGDIVGGRQIVGGELITFQACNDFANQRMSIVYGILMAMQLGKSLIFPKLPLDDTQQNAAVLNEMTNSVRFSDIYDLDYLQQLLHQYKVEVWEVDDIQQVNSQKPDCKNLDFQTCVNNIRENFQNQNDVPIDFGCIFPSKLFPKEFLFQNENLIQKILESLAPSAKYDNLIQNIITNIKSQNINGKYNAIHLRTEKEFIGDCKNMKKIYNGEIRDNCNNNQESIAQHLILKNIDLKTPLFIASGTPIPESKFYNTITQDLKLFGYNNLFNQYNNQQINGTILPKQIRELIDYFVALEAEKFVGNSHSFFSALLILERQFQGKWGSYYNDGNIPISKILPFFKLPLIIYSKCDNFDYFKQSTLIALRSGFYFGNLDLFLYCVGNIDHRIYEILKPIDVQIIRNQMIEKYVRKHDDLADIISISGITMLPYFDRYNHVFFIGPKIFIRKPIDQGEFQNPLPNQLSLYFFQDNAFSSLMIVNNNFIRQGMQVHDLRFIDNLQIIRGENQRDDKLLQSIQFADIQIDSNIIVSHVLSISDLELFLVSGYCPARISTDCDKIFRNGCQFLMEYLLISMEPQMYPKILNFCNRHWKNYPPINNKQR